MSSKKIKRNNDSSDDEDTSDEEIQQQLGSPDADTKGKSQGSDAEMSSIAKLKREKRLAMNRESARARRRRKKIRLETLEQRAEALSQRHHALTLQNQALQARVLQLEAELGIAGTNRATSSDLLSSGIGLGGLGGAFGGAAGLSGGGLSALGFGQNLTTQAELARLGGLHGGASGGGGSGGMTDTDLQLMQMRLRLQQQNALTSAPSGAAAGGGDSLGNRADFQRRNQLGSMPGLSDQELMLRAQMLGRSTQFPNLPEGRNLQRDIVGGAGQGGDVASTNSSKSNNEFFDLINNQTGGKPPMSGRFK